MYLIVRPRSRDLNLDHGLDLDPSLYRDLDPNPDLYQDLVGLDLDLDLCIMMKEVIEVALVVRRKRRRSPPPKDQGRRVK